MHIYTFGTASLRWLVIGCGFCLLVACGSNTNIGNGSTNDNPTGSGNAASGCIPLELGLNDIVFSFFDANLDSTPDFSVELTFMFDGERKLYFSPQIPLEQFSATEQAPNAQLSIEQAGNITLDDFSSGNVPFEVIAENYIFDGEAFFEFLLAGGNLGDLREALENGSTIPNTECSTTEIPGTLDPSNPVSNTPEPIPGEDLVNQLINGNNSNNGSLPNNTSLPLFPPDTNQAPNTLPSISALPLNPINNGQANDNSSSFFEPSVLLPLFPLQARMTPIPTNTPPPLFPNLSSNPGSTTGLPIIEAPPPLPGFGSSNPNNLNSSFSPIELPPSLPSFSGSIPTNVPFPLFPGDSTNSTEPNPTDSLDPFDPFDPFDPNNPQNEQCPIEPEAPTDLPPGLLKGRICDAN